MSERSVRVVLASLAVCLLAGTVPAMAAGQLSVQIVNGYNLVVDSNITSPSTYSPGAAYIGAKICNTGNAPISDVIAYTGNFTGPTPGVFPVFSSTGDLVHTQLTNTGNYSLTLESGGLGAVDATRYIGTLAAGECRVVYWLISYPHCVNVGGVSDAPPCAASIAGGIKPTDDLSLNYDVWATTSTAIVPATVSTRRAFTLRNEISASANKIWPNTTSKVPDEYLAAIQALIGWGTLGPDGQPLSAGNPVYPGQRVITTQGIWYDLGNVGQGFDNDGDLVPDQNAWLQPVGDAGAFDAACFRMVNVYGIVIVKLKSGGELLIPFQNQLYFEHLPENTGVVGLVYYQYIATDQGCSAAMTPYQEAASGFDNEKFSADFGLSNGLASGSFGTNVGFTKTDGALSTTPGSTLTYAATAVNTTAVPLGAPDLGLPLTIREAIPAGTTYVAGSAADTGGTNLTEPTGTGSFTQGYTNTIGQLNTCTINYNITSSSYVILYSSNNGATWSTTDPGATTTNIQWLLQTTIALDGGHDGQNCVLPNGVYDNGTLSTSLPPGAAVVAPASNVGVVRFRVTVNANPGPVVCNTANLGFGASNAKSAQDCDIVTGNNSLSGFVFKDDGVTGGIYGNGTKDGTEAGIGAGVSVSLYYDFDGDGKLSAADLPYDTTKVTAANGSYTFSNLPDGPFLVVAKKYDGPVANGINGDAVNDPTYAITGWGNTTTNPQLPLTTNQGILQMDETTTTVVLAVNIDLTRSNATGQTPVTAPILGQVNFGFAPPLRMTKSVANNPDADLNGRADTLIDEGDLFTYQIAIENRLPSVGRQGPTGCQYTAWATTGTNGSPAGKAFTDPNNAWDGPNRTVASALVSGGGNREIDGTAFSMRTQAGNITKVEALYMGYFGTTLTDDNVTLSATIGFSTTTTTFGTAVIDSYIAPPATLDPDSAITWNITAAKPGGGTWSWADNFSAVRLNINPSKTSAADQKTFFLDAIGIRITTDQNCVASASTTLSPVPLQDSYDTGSVSYVSASPAPTSINTATGIIQWNDVGPILAGSTQYVNVTMRALNVSGTRTGTCGGSAPPTLNSACNWAETDGIAGRNVYYSDGRLANDAKSKIAIATQGKSELRGVVWKDTNVDGWPDNDGEPRVPNVNVTLFGCVTPAGVMEVTAPNKTCVSQGDTWNVIATTTSDASGAYEFIGLDTGYYIIEIGDTDGAPATGNAAPYGGTQTAEANDNQTATANVANGTNGVCAGGCNNTWGNPNTTLSSGNLNLINSPATEEIIGGINFGYNIPSAFVYGNIWWDIDASTVQTAGETGLSGFTVQRWSDPNGDGNPADGVLQATTTTDANGNYSFSGLAAGNYVLVTVPPILLNKSWVETVESTGGTGSLNKQIPVTVTAGQISGSHNFGFTQSNTSKIGDTLFYDFNANGIQDSTESGIPNVTVWLYTDVDRDGAIDAGVDSIYATTVTNGAGSYLFSNLPAGSYVVKVDTTDTDFPSDVTPSGDPDLSAASIGDQIWLDANGNGVLNAGEDGIARVIVNLYSDVDSSGTLNGADTLVASTITNVNGQYLFTGLPAGRYFVDVDETSLPSSALVITTTDPANTLITLANGLSTTQVLTADAGYSPSANFAIGNRLWHDVDNDGVQDPGEPGIPFVDVVVTNGTGTGCAAGCRVSTDAAGFWIVTGLTNGTFTVNVDDTDVDFPRDFTVSTGTTDPRVITVASADRTDIDFGYRFTGAGSSPTGTISGRIFLDADGDLAYDVGEARSGTTANLIDSDGNIVATTTTAADGTYTFTGVFVGTYTLQSVDRLGTRYSTIFLSAAQTFPNLNIIYVSTNETVADSQSGVTVDGVHADLLQDFGYQRFLASIGDSVYWDVNENGTQDLGETGFTGVTVRLYDSVWTDANGDGFYEAGESTDVLVATTTTIADNAATPAYEGGTYLFSNLGTLAANHQYKVVVDTTTLPGTSRTLIADPDTDGTPCTSLTGVTSPPNTVCDSQQLISGFLPGNNYLGADFGYRINGTGFATIGDQLWIDADNDGVRDSGEPGIPAITVYLDTDNSGTLNWVDGNANGVWDSGEGERWTSTDPDGAYFFTQVTDGTYNLKVLVTDPDWPSTLVTTPTYEVRVGNTASRNNAVQVVVSGGAVTSIVDGDAATTDTCSSCNLNVDFGYRYAGTNALSGTVCTDDPAIKNGYCGATATTYTGTTTNENPLEGIQVSVYRWTDAGVANSAWDNTTGVLDAADTFVLVASTYTNSVGDYSFTGLPDNVVVVFSVPASQNLDLTTTNANTSVEDGNVLKRQLYEGSSTFEGNIVTVIGRQALNLAGDTDDIIKDLDYAFDPTLNGTLLYDFGDLPSTYGITRVTNSGAVAKITGGGTSIHFGPGITNEVDGTESATATADGNDDGVTMVSTELARGGGGQLTVNASAAGWIAAWFDFNLDGDFDDAEEQILDQPISAGNNTIYFYVPTSTPTGLQTFFSRFRIYPARPQIVASSGPGLDSNFARMVGEVEDYRFVMNVVPTAVHMLHMQGSQGKNYVALTWSTATEVDNLGFNVYRQLSGGTPEKINPRLIIGSAFVTGRKSDRARSYRFVDKKPPTGFAQYWIEDIDLNGTKKMNGPVTPVITTVDSPDGTATTEPDPTLGSVGGIFTTASGMGVAIPTANVPAAQQLAEQWQLAAVLAVKVIVTTPGWYRVTKADVVAAGFDPGSNAKVLSVYTDGVEVPVLVNAKNESKFDSADAIEFFGRGIDTPSTGGRVYYITAKKGTGLRTKTTGARGNSGSPAPPSFPYTFQRIERTLYFNTLTNNGDRDNFFGSVIGSWGATQSLTASNLDTTGRAQLEVVIQGATLGLQHVVNLKLNGNDVGIIRLGEQERHVETFDVAASMLVAGENTVTLTATNGDVDISALESLRLTYPHKFRADSNALSFTVPGGTAVTITGFTTDKVRVLDVTDPMKPDFIDATIGAATDGSKSASFATTNQGDRTIYAFADDRVLAPAQIAWNEPSTWNATTNGAKLLIITNKAFMTAANALKAARVAQGIPTVVVDVQNVYDEFSFGHHSPQAIRDFLLRTQSWSAKPRYAILLGDATFDPRNYLDFGSYDFVPTKMLATEYFKTAVDDWFADFNNTGVPVLALGRIPVRTAAEATGVVNKLIARTGVPTDAWAKTVELISDAPIGWDFDETAAGIAVSIPAAYTKHRISIATTPSPTGPILDAFNRGSLLMEYIGHGSAEMWGEEYFSSWDADALTNGSRLPFIFGLTCLNGYFQDLWTHSLAEALLNNPNGGAIGVWVSSSLTTPPGQIDMASEFHRQIFGANSVTVGDAILAAKAATHDIDVRHTWILFGDPTIRLK